MHFTQLLAFIKKNWMNYYYHHTILEILKEYYYYEPPKIQVEKGFQQENKPIGLDKEEILKSLKEKNIKWNFLNRLFHRKLSPDLVETILTDLVNEESIKSKFIGDKVLYWILDKGVSDYKRKIYHVHRSDKVRNNWVVLISSSTALIAVIISGLGFIVENSNSGGDTVEKYFINTIEEQKKQIKTLNDSLLIYKMRSDSMKAKIDTTKK